MKRKKLTIVVMGLSAVLMAVAGCSPDAPVSDEVVAAPAEPTVAEPMAEAVIQDFFEWYAAYPGNPIADGALAASPLVSPQLIEKVDAVLASFEGPGGHDPVMCAQDRPQDFRVELMDRSVDSVSAVVTTNFESHKIYVGALKVDGQWLIADVTCAMDQTSTPPNEEEVAAPVVPSPVPTDLPLTDDSEEDQAEEPSGAPDDWLVFADDTNGFQIAYPPHWGFMDMPVRDPGTDGPPTVIERFVIFYPQEWEERLRPGQPPDPSISTYPALSVMVCRGTMEAFRHEFMELSESEEIELNGVKGIYEQDTNDDYNLIRYIFPHPSEDGMVISVTDAVNGFSARVAESGEVASLIPVVAETFRFTD
jgi:hypothetical protein